MQKILCPHCGKEVELSEAFRHEMETLIAKETEEKVRKAMKEEASLEIEDLKKSLQEQSQKLDEMRKQELTLRQKSRELEEKEKEMELTMSRRIDEEKQKITEEVLKKADEIHRLKELEKEKVISDLKQALTDAQRKASQGSQQLQGEVLELDLEENLRASFPQDTIEGIGKGVRGADIRQIVRSPLGTSCGVILWESKRTKAWTDDWPAKLKEDLRSEKADIPVIITTTLPKDVPSGLGLYQGVWVVKYELTLALAQLLRKNILDVARQRAVSAQKADKASLLYDYVMGHEFRQQVEAMAEVYSEMKSQISKERMAFEKIWKARDAQITRMMLSTANIYGSIQGHVGDGLPAIKGMDLELSEGE